MKHLCITYHMTKIKGKRSDGSKTIEIIETCITLPMEDTIADDILEKQGESGYVKQETPGLVAAVLKRLAYMQGCSKGRFIYAEPDKRWKDIDERKDDHHAD